MDFNFFIFRLFIEGGKYIYRKFIEVDENCINIYCIDVEEFMCN